MKIPLDEIRRFYDRIPVNLDLAKREMAKIRALLSRGRANGSVVDPKPKKDD